MKESAALCNGGIWTFGMKYSLYVDGSYNDNNKKLKSGILYNMQTPISKSSF